VILEDFQLAIRSVEPAEAIVMQGVGTALVSVDLMTVGKRKQTNVKKKKEKEKRNYVRRQLAIRSIAILELIFF
jgi:hypothetical protein